MKTKIIIRHFDNGTDIQLNEIVIQKIRFFFPVAEEVFVKIGMNDWINRSRYKHLNNDDDKQVILRLESLRNTALKKFHFLNDREEKLVLVEITMQDDCQTKIQYTTVKDEDKRILYTEKL